MRLMDSATLPFPIEEKKLDTLPPGQAATNIIPSAKPGIGWISHTKINVKNGSNTNCEMIPVKVGLGFSWMGPRHNYKLKLNP